MMKRLNITLPERTVALMDRVVGKGQRSRLIDRAVHRFVEEEGLANLRKQLREGAQVRAERDLHMAEEWFAPQSLRSSTTPSIPQKFSSPNPRAV